MKGDIIIVEPHHREAASTIVQHLSERVAGGAQPFVISVAGESGSGKSETGQALKEAFESRGLKSFVFQQDDYFVLPPKSNDKRRREDISWVGTGEVRLDLLDENLRTARRNRAQVEKPLVEYDEDRIGTEVADVSGCMVLITEGTYTSLLHEVDYRVFIARNRLETLESRKKRGREVIEPFLEHVLEIEHEIIAPHREMADVIISRDYSVTFVKP